MSILFPPQNSLKAKLVFIFKYYRRIEIYMYKEQKKKRKIMKRKKPRFALTCKYIKRTEKCVYKRGKILSHNVDKCAASELLL